MLVNYYSNYRGVYSSSHVLYLECNQGYQGYQGYLPCDAQGVIALTSCRI